MGRDSTAPREGRGKKKGCFTFTKLFDLFVPLIKGKGSIFNFLFCLWSIKQTTKNREAGTSIRTGDAAESSGVAVMGVTLVF